jgi:hypothetical protein
VDMTTPIAATAASGFERSRPCRGGFAGRCDGGVRFAVTVVPLPMPFQRRVLYVLAGLESTSCFRFVQLVHTGTDPSRTESTMLPTTQGHGVGKAPSS